MEIFANDNTQITIKNILDYYYSKIKGDYIPGILNEGDLFNEKNELYIKVIAKRKDIKITRTWMKENLSKDYTDGIFNLISTYSYKYNSIYGICPVLLDDSYVTFVEQKDIDVLSMEFINNNQKIEKNIILYKEMENIMIYFPLVKDYTELARYNNDYELYAEIEYRVLQNSLNPDKLGSYFDAHGNALDLIYDLNNSINVAKEENLYLYWLRATVKLDCQRMICSTKDELNIKVVSLGDNKIRNLNSNNYNDDMNAGLIVFSKEAVTEIKKYYYFYDLMLIPKIENKSTVLVDYFDDIIVFWEGEFNSKLPIELKSAIQKYNIVDSLEKIISPAMFNWQLQCRWEIFDDLFPNQQLARIIMKDKLSLARDHELDFYPPENISQYSMFINKIFSILKISSEQLHLLPEKEKMLNDIISMNYNFSTPQDLRDNFYGFCYLIVKVVGYEKE